MLPIEALIATIAVQIIREFSRTMRNPIVWRSSHLLQLLSRRGRDILDSVNSGTLIGVICCGSLSISLLHHRTFTSFWRRGLLKILSKPDHRLILNPNNIISIIRLSTLVMCAARALVVDGRDLGHHRLDWNVVISKVYHCAPKLAWFGVIHWTWCSRTWVFFERWSGGSGRRGLETGLEIVQTQFFKSVWEIS
jgi:hypothetical protein